MMRDSYVTLQRTDYRINWECWSLLIRLCVEVGGVAKVERTD